METRQTPRAAEDRLTPFSYAPDSGRDFPKKSIRLMRTATLTVSAQIINQGGESNMHSHTNADEAWIVTAGRARFYGMSDDPSKGEEIDSSNEYTHGPSRNFAGRASTPFRILRCVLPLRRLYSRRSEPDGRKA